MKKGTLSLLIVLVLCLALSGCGRKGKQGVALTADSTGSVESSSGQNVGENTDDGTAGNTGKNADDSTAGNTGKNAAGSTGRNTGKTDTGSKTDKKTNRKTNKKTNKKTDNKAGQDTDNAADNKSDKNTGKVIAQTTGSSSSTDSSSGGSTDSNAAQNTGSTDSGSDSGSGNSSGSTGSSSGGGSGSSSGGGSTTPASPGNKLVESVADISDVTVEYGTDAAAAAAKLPGTVVLNCTDGSTIKGSVASWEVEASYNAKPNTQTSYTATGKVTIPDGSKSYYGTTLKATVKIIVRGGDTVIMSIKAPGDIEVAYGTNEAAAKKRLPSEVELTCVSGNVTFGTVTWNRKSGASYDAGLIHVATRILYTGTVKIPDGYRLDSSAVTTIETNIIVLEKDKTPKQKYVTSKSATLEIPIPYTTATDEIEANLPDKVRLYCEDDSVITVTVDKTKWVASGTGSGSGDYAQIYRYQYRYEDITLPEGYTFDTTIDKATYAAADICVKKRDNTKLYAAVIAARNLYYNRITQSERFAGGEDDCIFLADEGTTPDKVISGIKFIVNSGKNKEALNAVYRLVDRAGGEINVSSDRIDYYKPNENQAFVDRKAEEVNAATAALRKVLDNNYQIGTCFKTENIVDNVKALLESESFKKGGNYAYDPANYPMILGQKYMLPQYVTVVVDAKGTKAEVELEWDIYDGYITFDYKETDANGKKLRNAVVTPKSTCNNQPITVPCIVSVVGYQNGNNRVDLEHKQVEAYNNCYVGAPLHWDASVSSDRPVLTSGTENTFTVKAAFPYYKYRKLVERIEPDRITVENVNTTADGKPLLSNITVTGVNTDQDSPNYLPEFTMNATTALLDSPKDDQDRYVPGKVKLSIPADAITLTEYAKEQGWYLPEDGLELEVQVDILRPVVTVNSIMPRNNTGAEEDNPAVTVEDAQLSEDRSRVTVAFRTAHCSGSSIQTALVPNTLDAFDGTAAGSFVAEDAVAVETDGTYTADISASGIPAGDYTVWVKAGDGDWQKSTVTYTHTAADSDTDTDTDSGMDSGTGSDADSATNPGTGSDADSVTNPGTGSDADSVTNPGTGSDADSVANAGTGTDADSGTNPGTGSDTDPNTNTGADSDADTDTHSGTAAGAQPGGTQDGLVPENNPEPETELKDPTDE